MADSSPIRQKLAALGFTNGFQWLSGSFMENIETNERRPPNDIDVVTFTTAPPNAQANWQAFLAANPDEFYPKKTKAKYKCDAYFVDIRFGPLFVISQTRYWFGLFSHRRDGLWKGLVQVPLPITQDDTDASNLIVVP